MIRDSALAVRYPVCMESSVLPAPVEAVASFDTSRITGEIDALWAANAGREDAFRSALAQMLSK